VTEQRGTVSSEIAGVLAAAIDAAETSGILPCGGVYGDLVMPDPVYGACCDGSAAMGPQYCTCWAPAFDLEQQAARPGERGQRDAPCGDCAYRPGSPERSGNERYNGDQAFLDRIVETGEPFHCHVGIRRVVKLVHPSGAEVELPPGGDYRPPIVAGVPYKADGSPGELCAGWAARRLRHVQREAAAT
jgi:hypothetical protein